MNELMPLENINAVEIFTGKGLDDLINNISNEARSLVPDISTDKGRKELASMAAKVSKSKTYLDGLGKELVSEWKTKSKAVDDKRKKMRDSLDELKIEIRKPLTDFENIQKERCAKLEAEIVEINVTSRKMLEEWMTTPPESMVNYLLSLKENKTDWWEYVDRADDCIEAAKSRISKALDERSKYDTQQAMLESLRLKEAKRDQIERDERIAEEARISAEEKAKEEIEAANERERLAKEQAEIEAKNAAEEATRRERKRVEDERIAEEKEQKKRESDKKHKSLINNEAVGGLTSHGLTDQAAKAVVILIAQGKVPYVSISY